MLFSFGNFDSASGNFPRPLLLLHKSNKLTPALLCFSLSPNLGYLVSAAQNWKRKPLPNFCKFRWQTCWKIMQNLLRGEKTGSQVEKIWMHLLAMGEKMESQISRTKETIHNFPFIIFSSHSRGSPMSPKVLWMWIASKISPFWLKLNNFKMKFMLQILISEPLWKSRKLHMHLHFSR